MNKGLEMIKSLIGQEAKSLGVSPFGVWLNGKLLAAEEGLIEVEILVRPEFANPSGMIHGGVYAGIIDEVIGLNTFTLGGERFYAALNLNLDFLRPSKVGEMLIVKSQVVKVGKSILHIECQIFGEDGKMRAKATSNLAKTNFEFNGKIN